QAWGLKKRRMRLRIISPRARPTQGLARGGGSSGSSRGKWCQALFALQPVGEAIMQDGPNDPAAVHGMQYLLTWNCTHIANATLRDPIESICRENGYEPPAICTPDELLAEEGD